MLWLVSMGQADTSPAPPRIDGSISLSPSVVVLRGKPGESTRQTLRLTNHTSRKLDFELVANDIVVRDGSRVFVPAGETPLGIAATATFLPRQVSVLPGHTASVQVVLTTTPGSPVRAVAAIFSGRTVTNNGPVEMTASLGTLITFAISDRTEIKGSPILIGGQTATTNLVIRQSLTNTGTEPVIPGGMAAILDETGKLVAKMPVEAQRLLPGERLDFPAYCPSRLRPGLYRAVISMEFEGKTLTNSLDFAIL